MHQNKTIMKKILLFVVIIVLTGTISCVNTSKKEADSMKEEQAGKNACDEFLAHYEQWADEYFNAIEEYMNNPSDDEVAARYMELMQQAMEWSNEWVDLVECADDKEYKQQFEEISAEVEQKMQELNL
jgi:CHASE3 domain sensor protein